MTAPSYKLNPQSAREADTGGFQRIERSGAYEGTFTLSKHIVASTGAVGLEFSFKSSLGEEANFLTLYTRNAHGEPIFGDKQLAAMMTCMKLREIAPQDGVYETYDFDAKQNVKKQATLYPALMNKPIGVVMQREEYYAGNGDVKHRMNMVRFFEPGTKRTASEILDNSTAKNLESFLATLKDKTLAPKYPSQPPIAAGASDDYDDDFPF